jgi:hypothetical protein
MQVLLMGRVREMDDLTLRHAEVNARLSRAMATRSGDAAELQIVARTLEACITAARKEYDALEQWGSRRGLADEFERPSSPVAGYRITDGGYPWSGN